MSLHIEEYALLHVDYKPKSGTFAKSTTLALRDKEYRVWLDELLQARNCRIFG